MNFKVFNEHLADLASKIFIFFFFPLHPALLIDFIFMLFPVLLFAFTLFFHPFFSTLRFLHTTMTFSISIILIIFTRQFFKPNYAN